MKLSTIKLVVVTAYEAGRWLYGLVRPAPSTPLPAADVELQRQAAVACYRPRPVGWRCTRRGGHDGPCALEPSDGVTHAR